ncbi:MAG: hypothetical protein J6A15_02190 [Clostridia bacterium]|nr:hypothetical protein [Clostridia bacterium]
MGCFNKCCNNWQGDYQKKDNHKEIYCCSCYKKEKHEDYDSKWQMKPCYEEEKKYDCECDYNKREY